jgi:hypothetical protein
MKPPPAARAFLLAALVVGGVILGGAACGTSGAGAPPPGFSPVAAASAGAAPADGRARQRIDGTVEEYERLAAPYETCLVAHGMPSEAEITEMLKKRQRPPTDAMAAAERACTDLRVLPPWEKDPANPASKAFLWDVVNA